MLTTKRPGRRSGLNLNDSAVESFALYLLHAGLHKTQVGKLLGRTDNAVRGMLRRLRGECARCAGTAAPGKTLCSTHASREREKSARYRRDNFRHALMATWSSILQRQPGGSAEQQKRRALLHADLAELTTGKLTDLCVANIPTPRAADSILGDRSAALPWPEGATGPAAYKAFILSAEFKDFALSREVVLGGRRYFDRWPDGTEIIYDPRNPGALRWRRIEDNTFGAVAKNIRDGATLLELHRGFPALLTRAFGVIAPLEVLAKRLSATKPSTVRSRIGRGWSLHEALLRAPSTGCRKSPRVHVTAAMIAAAEQAAREAQ